MMQYDNKTQLNESASLCQVTRLVFGSMDTMPV